MNRPHYFKLDGETPVPCGDEVGEWAKWFETADRHVAETQIGEVRVSTVFLGIDHNFGCDGPPILFESMVLGGALDRAQERYATWERAEAGHALLVARVRASQSAGN